MTNMRSVMFLCIMMNIAGIAIAADENKLTAECITKDLRNAWDARDFDTALKMFFYIELCVEADWDKLSSEQIEKWGKVSGRLMEKIFAIYTGSERFTKVFTDDKGKKVQCASDLLKRLQDDQYAVDVAIFLGEQQPLVINDDTLKLKNERIAMLQRMGTVQPMP